MITEKNIAISVSDLTVEFSNDRILDKLNLDVYEGEILGFIGPSGCGKSVLMRSILGLNKKTSGSIHILGQELNGSQTVLKSLINRKIGVLFQHGALFSSLSVIENIQVPMREYLDISPKLLTELAYLKLNMVGLPVEAGGKYPSELSGGMIKRAALARALALDPDILFLDEPTSGLDPISGCQFNELIKKLQDTVGLTVYMITHDLDSLYAICDRIAVLGNKKVKYVGTIDELKDIDDPWLKDYFRSRHV